MAIKHCANNPSAPMLEQLLRRGHVWRGHSHHFTSQIALDTGHEPLNSVLLNKGWPLGSLVEVCQQNRNHSEWLLLAPALLKSSRGYLVLLNPPALPFAQGLIQTGVDLERVLVVKTKNKKEFLASFKELARSDACDALIAWQPQQTFSYTELRKCALAAAEGEGLYLFFRQEDAQQQSSPAGLRLKTELQKTDLQITVFKQKGVAQGQQSRAIKLPLPAAWHSLPPHRLLDQPAEEALPKAVNQAETHNNLLSFAEYK